MKTYALSVSILLLAASVIIGSFLYVSNFAMGSVISGGEYNLTYVDSSTGTTTARTLFGSIGSIVVSKTGTAGEINLYATTSQATSSADLIFSFDGTADEGTYQYDAAFGGGLLIEEKNYDGEAVVTHR